MPNWTIL